ncbi:MAG: putative 2-hydroxyacid dehydrogenase [Syntrophaceae bacterium PtaB.Bin095]|nr:MAG: putative 2-hydroxyacid dehydrogenase [Syntrophaceae bacterium PtaB.Bin095]
MSQKILVTGNLPAEVMDPLREKYEVEAHAEDRPMERQQLLSRIGDRDGLLCMITDAVDDELLGRAPRLKMIANMGVGYNHIDIAAATRRGIPVSNTPGVLTDATADLAFTLILAVARRVVEGDRRVREGKFKLWAPFLFLGREVSGKTLGIVGFGRIGRAVARRAAGFGMRVLYHNRSRLTPAEERESPAEYADLNTLLAQADFVSLHVPLSGETRHLIGAAELSRMKPTAYLINTARGPVVDEVALLATLQRGMIAGAGLDVYENEPALTPGLADLPNVVLLPHVGSATLETRTAMAAMAARNLIAGLDGQRPPNLVNPEVLPAAR